MKTYTPLLLIFFPVLAQAQTETALLIDNVAFGPGFWGALIAGILLALGFQLILTSLSVACGISAVGNIEKKGRSDHDTDDKEDDHSDNGHRKGTAVPVKISAAMGIWSAVTTSIALFCAVFLAVSALFPLTLGMAIVCGLATWAAFFLIMTYLDGKLLSSAAGTLTRAAFSGARGVGVVAGSLFAKSQAKQAERALEHTVDHMVDRIRDEIRENFDGSALEKKLEDYLHMLEPPRFDPHALRTELEDMLSDIRLEESFEADDDEGLRRRMIIEVASKQPHFSKQDVQQIKDTLKQSKSKYGDAKEILRGEGRPVDKGYRIMEHFAPGTDEDARETRERVEQYLRETGRDELNPDAIKDDIDHMVSEPSASKEIIKNRLSKIDRDTVKAALQTRQDFDEQKAEQVVQYVEKAIHFIEDKAGGLMTQAQSKAAAMQERKEAYQSEDKPANPRPTGNQLKKKEAEAEIARRINALERPELNYRALKRDFERMMDDPKHAPEVIQERLKKCDRNTVVALLEHVPGVSPAQAEKIVSKYEEAQQTTQERLEHVRAETERRLKAAKLEALHQAETARKTASSAAWWVTLTGILSGGFAAAAGVVAVAWVG